MLDTIRGAYFPYCIKEVKKDRFVILNREYKPLGQTHYGRANYKEHMVKIKRMTSRMAAKLSIHGDENLETIQLYNDGCVPESSPEHAAAYFARLRMLMRMKIEPVDE